MDLRAFAPSTEVALPGPCETTSPLRSTNARKRSSTIVLDLDSDSDLQGRQDATGGLPKRRKTDPIVQISGLVQPKSLYTNHKPSTKETPEAQVIQELKRIWDSSHRARDEYIIWKLDGFSIYRPFQEIRHPGDLTPLHAFNLAGFSPGQLFFDGFLSFGGVKRYVQRIPFQEVTVEGYGDAQSIDTNICIRSLLGRRPLNSVWYELGQPAPEYARYHKPFLWVSRFAKFFVDYLIEHECVTLRHFKQKFNRFLLNRYSHLEPSRFREWQGQYQSKDFRQALIANVEYLWKECWGLQDEPDLRSLTKHPLWGEARRLDVLHEHTSLYKKTVVTPFVYECFQKMPFASQLAMLHPKDLAVQSARASRRRHMKLTPLDCMHTSLPQQIYREITPHDIRKGHVVCIQADKESHHSNKWRNSKTSFWYAYVQKIYARKDGTYWLDLTWLYEPQDTTLGYGHYPFRNELFMSDNCSCGRDAINTDLVLGIVDVRWFARDPRVPEGSFFVRQKHRTVQEVGAYDFISLKRSDFRCGCNDYTSDMANVQSSYAIGDTVLVRQAESLEPAQIVSFHPESREITMRRLPRSARDCGDQNAKRNQLSLLESEDNYVVHASQVIRRCYVGFFRTIKQVTAPYNRDGAGDFFFIITSLDYHQLRPPFHQQHISSESIPKKRKLKGLGIFCGGGNFDRGLEEGGAVKMRYAVDWNGSALHTYRANVRTEEKAHFFLGSVNDYLAKAISGSQDPSIAKPGDVEFLAAGSPCPGFSHLQPDKQSEQSLLNCSLVAAVAAQVDFYTPQYMVLENVVGMADHPKGRPDLNVFSQILCSLVATGYQVQQFLMDPTRYGSCQTRGRIFVVATAPGCVTLPAPPQTHASRVQLRRIGRASNGVSFGEYKDDLAPFDAVSVRQAMGDLTNISESHVQTCIPYPDHRPPRSENSVTRNLISMVPRWPRGMGFVQTVNMRDEAEHGNRTPMGQRQIEGYPWQNKHRSAPNSKSWSRLRPDGPIGCLTTKIQPHDGFLGRVLHWDQPRVLTVMEARRAQGFPDDEIILGRPSDQWKIIGNSVDRWVAFALGLSLGKAWQETLEQQDAASTVQVESVVRTDDVPRDLDTTTASITVTSTTSIQQHTLKYTHTASRLLPTFNADTARRASRAELPRPAARVLPTPEGSEHSGTPTAEIRRVQRVFGSKYKPQQGHDARVERIELANGHVAADAGRG